VETVEIQTRADILLVEDNAEDIELALLAFKHGNISHKIQIVRDGEEALEFLFCRGNFQHRTFEMAPRLVLLDLKLPKVHGLEVLRELKNDTRTRAIPVVIMTSSREQQDLVEGYRLGLNSYIQKPVEFTRFREMIGRLGVYWLELNQPPPRDAFLANR
jgi:CheY-like chemotaxis protein